MLPKSPDEGRKIREMGGWDLCDSGQMLQAIRLDGPRQVIPEDLSDPSLLGTGEHGAAIVAERAGVGQRGRLTPGIQGVGSDFFSALRQSLGFDSLRAKVNSPTWVD